MNSFISIFILSCWNFIE